MKKNVFYLLTIFALFYLPSCSDNDDKEKIDEEEIVYTLSIDKLTLMFNNDVNDETQTFNITSNDSWIISVEENAWLSIDKTSGKENAEIKITAKENDSEVERNLTLTITGVNNKKNSAKITIKQTSKETNILDYITDPIFKEYLIKDIFSGQTSVTKEEAKKVTKIDVHQKSITSLEGLHFFTNLITLTCYDNKLTSLDLSKNVALVNLYCYSNSLTSLDLSKNIELKECFVKNNSLTSLDPSQNTKLVQLECSDNKLTEIDLSKNIKLVNFYCDNNSVAKLDVSKNLELSLLYCSNNKLSSLDLSNNAKLSGLGCIDNPLTSVAKSVKILKSRYDYMIEGEMDPDKESNIYDVID